MVERKENTIKAISNLPATSTSDLRGMQSVRATFRLSEQAIGAISIVATQLGIKQKSLFDHLMEDAQTLSAIAAEIAREQDRGIQRVQKTYVVSRKTLRCLERISREYDASRDALIEYSVKRLMPIIAREKEKHDHRKVVLDKAVDHYNRGLGLLKEAAAILGEEDPVTLRLEAAMAAYRNAVRDMSDYVKKGRVLEEF